MKRGLIITESILNLMKMCLISSAVLSLGCYNKPRVPCGCNVQHVNSCTRAGHLKGALSIFLLIKKVLYLKKLIELLRC